MTVNSEMQRAYDEWFPSDSATALRHLRYVVDGGTSVLDVLCLGGYECSRHDATEAYKRLAQLVHPDRSCGSNDEDRRTRAMRTLSRARELVDVHCDVAAAKKGLLNDRGVVVGRSVTYTIREGEDERWAKSEVGRRALRRFRRVRNRAEPWSGVGDKKPDEKVEEEEDAIEDVEQVRVDHFCRRRAAYFQPRSESDKEDDNEIEEIAAWLREGRKNTDGEEHDDEDDEGLDDGGYGIDSGSDWDERWDEYVDESDADGKDGEDFNMYENSCSEGESVCTSGRGAVGAGSRTGGVNACNGASIADVRKRSKVRAKERAEAKLSEEREEALNWIPKRCVPVTLKPGVMQFRRQWHCVQLIRAHTAYVGARRGVNLNVSWQRVVMTCRTVACEGKMVFNWQPKGGMWKLNKVITHCDGCCMDADMCCEEKCAPAYTSRQVARCVLESDLVGPYVTWTRVAVIVRASQIYRWSVPDRHYMSVRTQVSRILDHERHVEVNALDGFAKLLRSYGMVMEVCVLSGEAMKEIRISSCRALYVDSHKAAGTETTRMELYDEFNTECVNVSDLDMNGTYWEGFVLHANEQLVQRVLSGSFVSVAVHEDFTGHYGLQPMGSTCAMLCVVPSGKAVTIAVVHVYGTDCTRGFEKLFKTCSEIPGFDVNRRTTVIHGDPRVREAYKRVMKKAKCFVDSNEAQQSAEKVADDIDGAREDSALRQALKSTRRYEVQDYVQLYTAHEKAYVANYSWSELYQAYCKRTNIGTYSMQHYRDTCEVFKVMGVRVRRVQPFKLVQEAVKCMTGQIYEHKRYVERLDAVGVQTEIGTVDHDLSAWTGCTYVTTAPSAEQERKLLCDTERSIRSPEYAGHEYSVTVPPHGPNMYSARTRRSRRKRREEERNRVAKKAREASPVKCALCHDRAHDEDTCPLKDIIG